MIPLNHLAIIMDGNGRWAERQNRPRYYGHIKGAKVARSTIESCAEMGLETLSLFTFSTENWARPKTETNLVDETVKPTPDSRDEKPLSNIRLNLVLLAMSTALPKIVQETIARYY